jgi:tetratricopeptide (TPR) repeat protein
LPTNQSLLIQSAGVSRRFVGEAWNLLEAGDVREAVGVLRRGLLAQPRRLEGRLLLGAALVALGRFDEATREVRVALDLAPHSAAAHALLGEALLRQGDRERAIATFRRAAHYDPESETIQELLAEALAAPAATRDRPQPGAAAHAVGRESEVATRRYPISRPPDDGVEDRTTTRRLSALREERDLRLTEPHDVRDTLRALDDEVADPAQSRTSTPEAKASAEDSPTQVTGAPRVRKTLRLFAAVPGDERPTDQFDAVPGDERPTDQFDAASGDERPTDQFDAAGDERPTKRFDAAGDE